MNISQSIPCYFLFSARSDSPATRKRGLVSVDYSSGSKSKEPASDSSSSVHLNQFTLLRVIGRGSYAKVLLVRTNTRQRPLISNSARPENCVIVGCHRSERDLRSCEVT